DPAQNSYIISLLAGHSGGPFLQTLVSISAGALLIFASNTAIIGAYHVFMALARMEFFPGVILKRNKLRGTPHYSIALATGVPILVLIAVSGRVDLLGDMYAFGLLGAFSLTCLGLDIVRWRERRAARLLAKNLSASNGNAQFTATKVMEEAKEVSQEVAPHPSDDPVPMNPEAPGGLEPGVILRMAQPARTLHQHLSHLWRTFDFWLGVLTTFLVALAWSTNLIAKPLATLSGGSVALIGMG